MTVIKIKNSNVAGRVPASGDIEIAELGLNIADKKLYSKDAAGSVFEIGVAGDIPSGIAPPSSGNNVGDLYYDTSVGRLLYWDGSGWESVVKASGDNFTGDVTLGTDKITLDATGNIAAAGDIKAGERDPLATDARGVRIGVESSNGGVYTQAKSTATASALMAFQVLHGTDENFKVMYDGGLSTSGTVSTESYYLADRDTESASAALFLGLAKGVQKFKIGIDGSGEFAKTGSFGSYVSTPEYFVSNSATPGLAGLYAYNATGTSRTDSALIISNSNSSSLTTIDLTYDGAAKFAGGAFQVDNLGIIQTNVFTVGNIKIDSGADFDNPNIFLKATDGSATFAGPISPGDADSGMALVTVAGETGACLLSTNKTDITSARTANIGSPLRPWNNGYFASTVTAASLSASNTDYNPVFRGKERDANKYTSWQSANGMLHLGNNIEQNLAGDQPLSGDIEIILDGTDGSASFAGIVETLQLKTDPTGGGVVSYRTLGGEQVWRGGTDDTNITSEIFAVGDAEFVGNVQAGSIDGNSKSSSGTRIYSSGEVLIQKIEGSTTSVFSVYNGDNSVVPVQIKATGDATFTGVTQVASAKTGGVLAFSIGPEASGTFPAEFTANGAATFSGTVTATVVPPSDARFKENIEPAKPQLADVVALGGLLKNYDWNDQAPLNEEIRSQRQLGLIAQEAEKVCPAIVKEIHRTQTVEVEPAVLGPKGRVITEAVTKEVDDSYKGISQEALIMKLIGAVAELSAEVTALKAAKTTKK